jgi:lipoprotein-releasing system ATP-binding protein
MSKIIQVSNLGKSFHEGDISVEVLQGLNFSISESQRIAIVGASGSGKSTLLQLLGGLDKPTQGEIIICGNHLSQVSDSVRGDLRNKYLGFIYQFHHLLPEFTALENVSMPLMIRDLGLRKITQQAEEMLARVGLKDRLQHKPGELSGGERQRVAIARALVTRPKVILADEPTGNLDRKTAHQVFELMMEVNRELSTAIVMVTHDTELAETMDILYELKDGQIPGLATP